MVILVKKDIKKSNETSKDHNINDEKMRFD